MRKQWHWPHSTVVMINELIFIKHFSVWPMVKYHVSVHCYLPRVRHSARHGKFFLIALKILQCLIHYLRFAVMLCDLPKIILLISSGDEALPETPAPQPGPFANNGISIILYVEPETQSPHSIQCSGLNIQNQIPWLLLQFEQVVN